MQSDHDTFATAAIDAAIRVLCEVEGTISIKNIRKILWVAGLRYAFATEMIEQRIAAYKEGRM